MQTGRRATDWLSRTAAESGERRGPDRRGHDRRAPRRRFDPLFTATLVNQIAQPETPHVNTYAEAAPNLRAGAMVNLRA